MNAPATHQAGALFFDPKSGRVAHCDSRAAQLLAGLNLGLWRNLSWYELEPRIAGHARSIDGRPPGPRDTEGCETRDYGFADGSVLSVTTLQISGQVLTVLLRDVTPERQELRKFRLFDILAGRIAATEDLGSALKTVLRTVGRHADWQYAEAWLPGTGGSVLELGPVWHAGLPSLAEFERRSQVVRYGPGEGIPGRVWQHGNVEHVPDLARQPVASGQRQAAALAAGLRCVHALPLTADAKTLAVLVFASFAVKARDRLIWDLLHSLAPQLSLALSRKQLESRNAVMQRRLADLLDTAGDAIVSIDAGHCIVLFNRCAEEMFGYTAEEVIGQPLDILVPASAGMAHRQQVDGFARAGGSRRRAMGGRPEIRGRRKDGSEFPAEAAISKLVVDGRLVFTAVVRDLTDLRAAETAIREREAQLRSIIDAMPVGVSLARGSDGTIVLANESLARMLGVPLSSLIGRSICDFYVDPGSRSDLIGSLKVGNGARQREVEFRRRSGDLRWAAVAATLIRFGGEDVVLAGAYDVTGRRQALDALRRSEGSLAEAQRIARLGNWDWDIASGALSWSDEIYRIFGLSAAAFEPTYAAFLERVHREDRAVVEEAVAGALERDVAYSIDHRIVRPDGTIRIVHEQAELTRDSTGAPIRMIGTVQDITDRKRIEEDLLAAKNEAEAASRAKSQFLANMSHELRTPLNAIIGFSELIASGIADGAVSDRYREYGRDIGDSGRHLLAIINHILDLSRVEAGALDLEESEVDLRVVIEACLRMVRPQATAGGVTLEQDLPGGLPLLRADERLCRQILLNLLANAVKFTRHGGDIRVKAERSEQGGLALIVSDSGIGMAPEDIPKALSPFMQLDNGMNRRYQGAGLGLSLTEAFVQAHGGSMTLDSQPGVGTCVSVRFPAERVVVADTLRRA